MLTEPDVKKIFRKYMRRLGYGPDDSYLSDALRQPRNGAYVDDLFIKLDVVNRKITAMLIAEYKAPRSPLQCLWGIGQLLHYSNKLSVQDCVLVFPEDDYSKVAEDLDDERVSWFGMATVGKDGVKIIREPQTISLRLPIIEPPVGFCTRETLQSLHRFG